MFLNLSVKEPPIIAMKHYLTAEILSSNIFVCNFIRMHLDLSFPLYIVHCLGDYFFLDMAYIHCIYY